MFLGVNHTSHPTGAGQGPSAPEYWGSLIYVYTALPLFWCTCLDLFYFTCFDIELPNSTW